MDIKKIFITLLLLTSLNLYAGAGQWHEFEPNGTDIIVDVKINGVPAKALLSTGWSDLGINLNFLEENEIKHKKGKKILIRGLLGRYEDARTVKELNLDLFDNEFPIKHLMPFYGDDIDLVLGMRFFSSFIVQIDYPQSRLRLIERNSVDMKAIKNVEMRHGTNKTELVVRLRVNDNESLDLKLINTIESGLLIDRHYAENKGWVDKYTKSRVDTSPEDGILNLDTLELPLVQFGPYKMQDVVVNIPAKGSDENTNFSKDDLEPKAGTYVTTNKGFDGMLGYDILKHFVITLDAKTARMHIIAPE